MKEIQVREVAWNLDGLSGKDGVEFDDGFDPTKGTSSWG